MIKTLVPSVSAESQMQQTAQRLFNATTVNRSRPSEYFVLLLLLSVFFSFSISGQCCDEETVRGRPDDTWGRAMVFVEKKKHCSAKCDEKIA